MIRRTLPVDAGVDADLTPDQRAEDRRIADAVRRRTRPADWRNPDPKTRYDLCIFGAGPAGFAAAELAARHGLKVALIERHRLGGNSLHSGSIPSKTLISAARDERARLDFSGVMRRIRGVRARIAEHHSVERLTGLGVDLFFGAARFTGRHAAAAADTVLRFKKALIATGARPRFDPIPGLAEVGYLTSEDIFDVAALPPRLAVIGGGPLGCELAQAFNALGSHVTIVQRQAKFLPRMERDAADLLSRALSADGVETRLNTQVVGARWSNGEKLLDVANNELCFAIAADAILLSVGRGPNVTGLGLEAAGVDFNEDVGVKVDDYLRTTNPDIYAAGDVCIPDQFTNIAETTARIAIGNAFARRRRRHSHLLIPRCTYCTPEIAQIGLDHRSGRLSGIPIKSFTIMMHDVDRAVTDGIDKGFVKLYVRDGGDQILGATIVAARASEMINEISVIMHAGIGMRELARIVHTYPAQSGAIRLAALAYWRNQSVMDW
jgi:pyruvate/2-oxoglutarate dehydrogenase complex dihydrolipoamide dehydrogenase (E3) component